MIYDDQVIYDDQMRSCHQRTVCVCIAKQAISLNMQFETLCNDVDTGM